MFTTTHWRVDVIQQCCCEELLLFKMQKGHYTQPLQQANGFNVCKPMQSDKIRSVLGCQHFASLSGIRGPQQQKKIQMFIISIGLGRHHCLACFFRFQFFFPPKFLIPGI